MEATREAMDLYTMLSDLTIPDSGLSYENYIITKREHIYHIYEYEPHSKESTKYKKRGIIHIWDTKYVSTSTTSENKEDVIQRFKSVICPYLESRLYFQ